MQANCIFAYNIRLLSVVRNDSALVGVIDVLYSSLGVKCIGQSLDLCRRLIAFLDCNDVDILLNGITFCRLGCKSIRSYVQACLQGIVSVDDTECNAGKLLRNLGSLNLNQLQVVRILCYIVNGCGNADTVIKLDQAFLLQKKQSSCLIGGVVRLSAKPLRTR